MKKRIFKAISLSGLAVILVLSFMPKQSFATDDFDGDGRTDLALYQPSTERSPQGRWWIMALDGRGLAQGVAWGFAGCIPVSGDYDGDGRADLAVYHPATGKWHIRSLTRALTPPEGISWGFAGTIPVPGDYDGDGKSDLAVYHPDTGKWHIRSLTQRLTPAQGVSWGFAGTIPVPGDYDGDGRSDLAVYQESTGNWYIAKLTLATGNLFPISRNKFGGPRMKPVSGDPDGDGYSDLVVYNVDDGLWFIYSIRKNQKITWRNPWGYKGAIPVSGNYDGDVKGKDDLAVYDLKNGIWNIKTLGGRAIAWKKAWGAGGMIPVSVDHISFSPYVDIPPSIRRNIRLHFGFGAGFEPLADFNMKWDSPRTSSTFNRHFIEKKKGIYDFMACDNYVRECQQRDILPLATIWPYTEWDQAYWRQQAGWVACAGFASELPTSRYKPHDWEAYRKFVHAMVDRYNGDGIDDMPGLKYPIRYWEVANEPETSLWDSTQERFFIGVPEDYMELLQITYLTINSTDGEAIVLNGGATGASYDSARQYWEDLFILGARRYFNIGNFHTGNATDENYYWTDLFISTHNLPTAWVTEMEVQLNDKNDEQDQARRLVQWYVERFARGVDKIFHSFYSVSSSSSLSGHTNEALIVDGRRLPAYYAMKTMVRKIEGFSTATRLGDNTYKFMVGSKPVYVIWLGGDLALIAREVNGPADVTTMLGSAYRVDDILFRLGTKSSTIYRGVDPAYIEPAP